MNGEVNLIGIFEEIGARTYRTTPGSPKYEDGEILLQIAGLPVFLYKVVGRAMGSPDDLPVMKFW